MGKADVLRVWGLVSNPFEVKPLQSNKADMALFVGRELQLNRVLNVLQDTAHHVYRRIGILGQVGTGKTSFLNRVLYELGQLLIGADRPP